MAKRVSTVERSPSPLSSWPKATCTQLETVPINAIDTPKLLASLLSALNATFVETSASRRLASGREGN
jgi:hypothetical protein